MKLLFNPSEIPSGLVAAIGNFDGVHRGHQEILKKVKKIASDRGLESAVISFEPHPIQLFRPEKLPIRLTNLASKAKILEKLGVEYLIILKFNRAFSQIPAEDFVNRYLQNNHIVAGHDFCFGKERQGNSEMLTRMLGNNYAMIEPIGEGEKVYSSSLVRKAIKAGDMREAANILGHNYFIEGRVLEGSGNGHKLGFPTANIRLKSQLIRPKYGVYAVKTNYGDGVANFGVRPTLDGKTELLEVHIFNFDKKIYGEKLCVEFKDYLREEMKFSSVDDLKNQIRKDCERAKLQYV